MCRLKQHDFGILFELGQLLVHVLPKHAMRSTDHEWLEFFMYDFAC